MIKPTLLLLGLSLSMAAFAQSFTRIDEFTGTYQDDFESYPNLSGGTSITVLNGHATAEVQPTEGLEPSVFIWTGIPTATSGDKVLSILFVDYGTIADVRIAFSEPMLRFGANWWVEYPRGDSLNITAFFWGPRAGGGETLIGMEEVEQSSPDPLAPQWLGWEASGGITAITFRSNFNLVSMDDMRITPVPEPGLMAVLGAGIAAMQRRRRS